MTIRAPILAAALALSMPLTAHAQSPTRTPTIPETQLEPRRLSTPYEFVAVASSLNAFQIETSKLALSRSRNEGVKALAQTIVDTRTQAQQDLLAAGKAQKVEIATPGPDGEQDRVKAQLEEAEGETFDQLYVKSQVFAHQRAIPIYQGYEAEQSPLGAFAVKTIPALEEQLAAVTALAVEVGVGDPAQTPAADSDTTSATE